MNDHSVSVIIPTHNRRYSLARAIESCLSQSYPVTEVIIVDDASTDDTVSLVSEYSAKDSRVRYAAFSCNQGPQAARIAGMRSARTEWLAFLDSDSELTAHSIRARIEAAKHSRVEPGLVYGDILIDLRTGGPPVKCELEQLSGHAYPRMLRKIVLCSYNGIMLRKSCLLKSGYPDPALRVCEDYDMMLGIAKYFPILHCGSTVALQNVSKDSLTADIRKIAEGRRKLIKRYRMDILRHHGFVCLAFWHVYLLHLRLRAFPHRWRITQLAGRMAHRLAGLYFRELAGAVGRS